ncbi:MAG: hypothetical protein KTR19_08665 [Hyphomicrobiales bacterium]|nr:hypothetical protein [Hyphomicrobiales bacterium]
MAYVIGAGYTATPQASERSSVARRIFGWVMSAVTPKSRSIDVNSLKDWTPAKLRSFGYTDLQIDYLFAKANQLK